MSLENEPSFTRDAAALAALAVFFFVITTRKPRVE